MIARAPLDETLGMSYARRISELARTRADEVAVISVAPSGAERLLTWQDLDDLSEGLAAWYVSRGVIFGDRVAVALANSWVHLVCCVAAWKVGAVPVVLRSDLPDWERRRVLAAVDPRLTVEGDPDAVASRERSAPVGLDDVVSPHRFGVCTSGSTGTPKVVLHAAPARYVAGECSTSALVEAYQTLSYPQTLLVLNALYHSSSITTASLNMVCGSRTVVLEKFEPEVVQEVIARHRVTGFMAPTPILQRLARSGGLRRDAFATIEWVQHGAAPLPEWLARQWIELLGEERFFTSYGAAEAPGVVACRGDEWLEHPGTLGHGVLGTDIAIIDERGEVLGPNQLGTIYLRRPNGPQGTYLGRGVEELAIREDGFVTVGDLGWLDDDGFLFMADRRVDLIVSGGANVYPAEVEAAISEHPEVADVVVIGLPDLEWGHRVHAIVQRSLGSLLTALDVQAYARSRLARYKVPKSVELVDRIPRSAAMKVNRQRLVEERLLRDGRARDA